MFEAFAIGVGWGSETLIAENLDIQRILEEISLPTEQDKVKSVTVLFACSLLDSSNLGVLVFFHWDFTGAWDPYCSTGYEQTAVE